MANTTTAIVNSCPNSKVFISGYSQGIKTPKQAVQVCMLPSRFSKLGGQVAHLATDQMEAATTAKITGAL